MRFVGKGPNSAALAHQILILHLLLFLRRGLLHVRLLVLDLRLLPLRHRHLLLRLLQRLLLLQSFATLRIGASLLERQFQVRRKESLKGRSITL
jgi:hypothetical protein